MLRLMAASSALIGAAAAPDAELRAALEQARALDPLHTLMVVRNGTVLAEHRFRGPAPDRSVNIKSVSKTIIASLVGIAIRRGHLTGVDQPVAPLLRDKLPRGADPRLHRVTIGHLLSMQAGLERTSGPFYGRWVSSPDWVRFVLARPFVADPGGPMLYSTGNTHLLSAILTRRTGRSTLELARDWLGDPLNISIPPWPRDPQGIFFGGNDMLMSPRALSRFAAMVLSHGRVGGTEVVPRSWIEASWQPQARSAFTGDSYGYGWFRREDAHLRRYYAWGFGGQMIHVVPDLGLSIVMTSDPTQRSGGSSGHSAALHRLVEQAIIPAFTG